MVVEDTKPVSWLIDSVLRAEGVDVFIAEDGESGLNQVKDVQPDLIILDLMLPGIHGIEVLRRLKADPETHGMGVILCTSRHYKPDHDQALEMGAYGVLTKPFQRRSLLRIVDHFFTGLPAPTPSEFDLDLEPNETSASNPTMLSPSGWRYRFWGTRGSIPVSGARYVRYGGNTSCMDLGEGEESLILDAGSGLRDLGMELARRGPRRIHLLITHTHWDHIQGFPFFAPAYIPGFEIQIYGARGFGSDLKSAFTGQLDREYFPVQFEDMRARIEFRHLEGQGLEIAGSRVYWEYTHHPAATVCFRVENGSRSIGYISDNEFLFGYHGAVAQIQRDSEELLMHRRLVQFMEDVDLLVAEAQYTREEYERKVGWGHSSTPNAVVLASLARVKSWLVTHHDPEHDDVFLDQQLLEIRRLLKDAGSPTLVGLAYDGLVGYLD